VHLGATGLVMETALPLLRAARDSRVLKTFHLDGHPKAKKWLRLIAKAVAKSQSGLEEVTMRNCNVTDEDALFFVDFFRSNVGPCSLQLLRLERNKLLDKAATRERIADAVVATRRVNAAFKTKITFVPDPQLVLGPHRRYPGHEDD